MTKAKPTFPCSAESAIASVKKWAGRLFTRNRRTVCPGIRLAWGAGLLLDANIHFGDPQGFLGLRVLLPILAMGLCLLRAMKENKRDRDK